MTNCTANGFVFPPLKRRSLAVEFNGGAITSDGGAVRRRQLDHRIGLTARRAPVLPDPRDPRRCEHRLHALRRQRIYGLALGYEDRNDHQTMRQAVALPTTAVARDPPLKELKGDLAIRPIYHQQETRIEAEAHLFSAFGAYGLQVTLKQRLRALAPGLTPRAVLDKLAVMQLVEVQLPTTDDRYLALPRYTQPDRDQQLILPQRQLWLPPQPPPQITTKVFRSA